MEPRDDMDDAALDRLLATLPPPAVPAPLAQRILADFDRLSGGWTLAKALRRGLDAVWPGAPAWQPACAFALAALIGLGVAAFAPLELPSDDLAARAFGPPPDLDVGPGV